MFGEPVGDVLCIVFGPLNSNGKSAHPAKGQVAVERAWSRAKQHPARSERLCTICIACDQSAEQQIRMPRQCLGDTVHDDVGAHLQRPLQDGRGKRVVHQHDRARCMC